MASDRILYWASGSPPCWRVLIVLEYKELPYESRVLSFDQKEHKTDEMLALNPRGELPVLQDGDAIVNESGAALVYLESQYPEKPLIPSNPAVKARVYQRLYETLASQGPLRSFGMAKMSGSESDDETLLEGVKNELKLWDTYLSEHKFIAADEFTLAGFCLLIKLSCYTRDNVDAMFVPYILTTCRYGATLKDYPNLKRYADMAKDYPAVKKTTPPHWAEEPPKYDFMNVV